MRQVRPGRGLDAGVAVGSVAWHAAGVSAGGLSAAGRLARVGGLLGGLPVRAVMARYSRGPVCVMPPRCQDGCSAGSAGRPYSTAGLASVSMAYGVRGRCPESEARRVFGTLAGLLRRRARWWASAGPMGSSPVARHTFDAVVAGVGAGVIAAVLAFDED